MFIHRNCAAKPRNNSTDPNQRHFVRRGATVRQGHYGEASCLKQLVGEELVEVDEVREETSIVDFV